MLERTLKPPEGEPGVGNLCTGCLTTVCQDHDIFIDNFGFYPEILCIFCNAWGPRELCRKPEYDMQTEVLVSSPSPALLCLAQS